jgi:hypothetical protein
VKCTGRHRQTKAILILPPPFFDGDPSRAERIASLLSRVLSLAALLLIAATWPLWTPQTVFPRVPFVGIFRGVPGWLEGAALIVACCGLVLAFVAGSSRRIGRWSLAAFAGALVFLALADQHRLQPWAYQFSLLALVLAVLPAGEGLAWARLLTASIYFYSALSKLDGTFLESGGGQIVAGLLTFLHAGDQLSEFSQRVLASTLAVGELLVAMGLCWRRSRRAAFVASLVMHALLLAALGPWGAQNQPGVLLWNVFFIVQNIVLFGFAGERGASTAPPLVRLLQHGGWHWRLVRQCPGALDVDRTLADKPPVPPANHHFAVDSLLRLVTWTGAAIRCMLVFALIFPLTEPFGLCDVWPAWAVYATGPERLRVLIDAADRQRLPAALQRLTDEPRFVDGRCMVRIDRWSLETTRAPLYPQNRFRLGVALALARAAGLEQTIQVEIESPANRWTGRRSTRTLTGSAALAAELNGDWLNGFPR